MSSLYSDMNRDMFTIIFGFLDGYQKAKMIRINKMAYNILSNDPDKLGVCDIFKYFYANFTLNHIKKNGEFAENLFAECIKKNNLKGAIWLHDICMKTLCEPKIKLPVFSNKVVNSINYVMYANLNWEILFDSAFNSKNSEIVLYIYKLYETTPCYDPDLLKSYVIYGFSTACCLNSEDIIKWIYKMHPSVAIVSICGPYIDGVICKINFDTGKTLYPIMKATREEKQFFEKCLVNGNLEIAKWVWDQDKIKNIPSILFLEICRKGHLNAAKWVYDNNICNCDIHEATINMAKSKDGKISFIKWLVELKEFDKLNDTFTNNIFIACCKNYPVEFVTWLYNATNCNAYAQQNKAFYEACCNTDERVIAWLYMLGGFDECINNKSTYACIKALRYNNYKIAEWLYSLGKVKINEINVPQAVHWVQRKSLEHDKFPSISIKNIMIYTIIPFLGIYAITKTSKFTQ